jgi:hypothetical protein
MTDYKDYMVDLLQRYMKYQETQFANEQTLFDSKYVKPANPPVFIRSKARENIITNPSASEQEKKNLYDLIPESEFHQWYRSMNSSQALTHSILGNLFAHNCLHYLSELKDDEGIDLFGRAQISSDNFTMEYKVNYLGESHSHSTSLDGYVSGDYRIAIECKFTETEVGTCSHAKSTSKNPKPPCDGNYSMQGEKERCLLTERKRKYWQYVPQLFKWKNDSDLYPCPLNKNYQLVRNILAVGVKPDGTVSVNNGHAILIYDERNPAFRQDGDGFTAYTETRAALQESTMLRKCSWQRIVQHLREKNVLPWLTENLSLKYGL